MGVVLGDDDIERFVTDGFIRLERAFHPELAARCVDELWSMLPIDCDDPTGWQRSGRVVVDGDRFCFAVADIIADLEQAFAAANA